MRDVAETVLAWRRAGRRVAVAMVVGVQGSAPRPLGSAMVVDEDSRMAGSVSAGCVEAAVVALALEVVRDGRPRTVGFGITDDAAISAGLTCGGQITVAIFEPTTDDLRALECLVSAVEEASRVRLATVLEHSRYGRLLAVTGSSVVGHAGGDAVDDAVIAAARRGLCDGPAETDRTWIEPVGEDVSVLVQTVGPVPRLIIFGASDYAVALAAQGLLLDYRVTVCDARAALVTRERFPPTAETVVQWPHRYLDQTEVDERTMICVLTHDAKFDVPLLTAALRTDARYIGVLGSRRTQDALLTALTESGIDSAALARIRGPIGLDLAARTPAETAVSIAAELIASRGSASGRPLRDLTGAIHSAPATA